VSDYIPDVQDAPIVESIDDVPDIDALVVGIAPIGGGFDESWRPDVRGALERGCDIIAGLHYLLAEDEEFAALAADHDCDIWDVREPPDDLTVSDGTAGDVDATVVLTVGTDCSSGKMTTTFELAERARERGIDAGIVPTGQTGIMIERYGIAVDRVISDFAAGAVEQMVEEQAADHDVLFVEGQGALGHPAYSGVTTAILHGAMPDHLVFCHVDGKEVYHSYEHIAVPDVGTYARRYEQVADLISPAPVAAGVLNTAHVDDEAAAREAVAEYGDAIDAPATDPIRFGVDPVLDAVLEGEP
jgi:uncharacterized NAD-dependent epimerase/dehydratase family protein